MSPRIIRPWNIARSNQARHYSASALRAIKAATRIHGLRVICLVCGLPQRFYPGGPRRLRDTPCQGDSCGERALRSAYWIAKHPELARDAATRARAIRRALL